VGSIVGTFATGFFLISLVGTGNLLFLTGAVLLAVTLLFLDLRKTVRVCAFLAILLLLWPLHYYLFRPRPGPDTVLLKESDYYTIKVVQSQGSENERLVTLYLDQLTHSRSDLDNPLNLQYRYIRSYREILRWKIGKKKTFATLSIGGGGYTFPRFLEASYPKARIDVVEIDPAITRISREYMGVPRDSRIRTFNEDGRWFAINSREESVYDFVFMDAFNDLSIPYHLTTVEFVGKIKKLLKKDGLLVANIIDRFERGSFLPAYIRTLEEVFGEGMVHLVTMGPVESSSGVDNRVVIANLGEEGAHRLAASLSRLRSSNRMSYVMPSRQLRDYLSAFSPILLTDDYAPVDNLTAANFR
jgi:spermidine synthase